MVDFFDGWENFTEPSFETGLVEVLPNRFVKLFLVLHDGFTKLFQLLDTLLGARLGYFPAIFPLSLKNIFDIDPMYFVHTQ